MVEGEGEVVQEEEVQVLKEAEGIGIDKSSSRDHRLGSNSNHHHRRIQDLRGHRALGRQLEAEGGGGKHSGLG